VLRALLGRSVGWDAQARGDRGVTWGEALRRHSTHLIIGLLWGGAILVLAPAFIGWMLPVIVGMLLAVPLTVLTSRVGVGRALRRHGWLLTPEETAPPPELAAAAAAMTAGKASAESAAGEEAPARLPQPMPLPMIAQTAAYWRVRPVPRGRTASVP